MIRVGVVRGGTSSQYDTSLASGAFVLRNLPRDKYQPVDIFIDQEGLWHIGGIPMTHESLRHKVDVVWNALHGFYGEDGKLQQLLENLAIPYVGTTPYVAAMTMHKKLLNDAFNEIGLKVQPGVYVESWGDAPTTETITDIVGTVSRRFSPPWDISPISRGYTNMPTRAKTRDELFAVLQQMCESGIPVLIEEVVFGKRAGIVLLDGFRKESGYALLPYQRDEKTSTVVRLRGEQKAKLEEAARRAHKRLGLGNYAHLHAILTPKGEFYFTHIETVPRLHDESILHSSLAEVGASFAEFADHLITSALK